MFSGKTVIFVCALILIAGSAGIFTGAADVKAAPFQYEKMMGNVDFTAAEKLAENESTASERESDKFTFDMLIVLAIVVFLIVMFLLEVVRIDFIGLSIPVILVFLQKWTGVTAVEAISGFSNNATITVLAMFIISGGVYRSGIVQILVEKIEAVICAWKKWNLKPEIFC